MARYTATERIGVNAVEKAVLEEFGWIFREQMIVDMGIDAHIELVEDGDPAGKLIALQIKTGKSHFHETTDHYTFYGKIEHYDYWLNHSLPVILIGHLPDTGTSYWVEINETTAQRTSKHWKVELPKNQIFDSTSKVAVAKLFNGTPIQQKFRQLTIDLPLMTHIQNNGKVCVELEEWINKSLGRTPIKVIIQHDDGSEDIEQEWFQLYTGLAILDLIHRLFPWASVSVDEDFYEMHDELLDSSEYGDGYPDDEYTPVDPRPEPEEYVYPYTNAAGEVDYYRLQLHLNELGSSFLKVHAFLSSSTAV